MDTWKLKDLIRRGAVEYNIGDIVVLFRRKSSGYPNGIEEGKEYRIWEVAGDSIVVNAWRNGTYLPESKRHKVHKSYMIHKEFWRDWKLSLILED